MKTHLCSLALLATLSCSAAKSKPTPTEEQPPVAEMEPIPDYPGVMLGDRSEGLPIAMGDSFSLTGNKFGLDTHTWLTSELDCADWLNEAHYRQDIVEQVLSSAHFDNCDFDGALDKVQARMAEARQLAKQGDRKGAIKVLGQIVHAVQDFYAHSNFVELMEKEYPGAFSSVRPLRLWTTDGRKAVDALRKGTFAGKPLAAKAALVTGVVWWGFPKRCPSGTPSHGALAKDSVDSDNGRVETPAAWGFRRYHAARELAQAETQTLITEALTTWPELGGACGDVVAFTVFNDRRRPRKEP